MTATTLLENDRELTFEEAYELIGRLSKTSKMPWYSWSIPAKTHCKTGGKLAEKPGTICSLCYAAKGFYVMPNVKAALQRRLEALEHPLFVPAFVMVLNYKYERTRKTTRLQNNTIAKENRFRWHDSGDLQDISHLRKVVQIALLTPQIDHYLPTKEVGIINQFLKGGGIIPKNLHIKLSHPMIGGTFGVKRPLGLSYTTAGRDNDESLFQCPALKKQGNKCLDCRACWSTADVNYPTH